MSITETTSDLERVDTVDREIITLLRERTDLVHAIQQARIAESGRGTSRLSRENQVISHYGDALGAPGVRIALQVLELCRYRREDNTPTARPAPS
jgi:chorismate mutase